MKKIIYALTIAIVLLLSPLAQSKAASVNVSATIPSKVCIANSSVTTNVTQLLADLSQRAVVTVKLYDCLSAPLKDITVTISSNRGSIDWIRATASDGVINDLVDGFPVAKTDENGFAFFRVASKVPGEALFTVNADTLVNFEPFKITFLPLPFPTNVTIAVEVPSFINPEKKITLFKPSGVDVDKDKLVNLGVEVIIPFWVIASFTILFTLTPILFVLIALLLRQVKKYEKENKECLEKEKNILAEEAENIKKEKEDIEEESHDVAEEKEMLKKLLKDKDEDNNNPEIK